MSTGALPAVVGAVEVIGGLVRSEEHTSELQSPDHLVCRLLLEKKKKKKRKKEKKKKKEKRNEIGKGKERVERRGRKK